MTMHPLPTKEQRSQTGVRGKVHTLPLVPPSLLLANDRNWWQTHSPDTILGLCFQVEVAVATELGETLWFCCLFTRRCEFRVGHQNEICYLHRSLDKLNIHHNTISG